MFNNSARHRADARPGRVVLTYGTKDSDVVIISETHYHFGWRPGLGAGLRSDSFCEQGFAGTLQNRLGLLCNAFLIL